MNPGKDTATSYRIRALLGKVIGKWPYHVALRVLKKMATQIDPKIELHARNSFKTAAFVSGVSDLDLTIQMDAQSQAQVSRILNKVNMVKKAFPAIGELNLYERNLIPRFIGFANHNEIQRDPILFHKYQGNIRPRSDAEDFVFLLRQLYSDRNGLLLSPQLRKKKWKNHFAIVGEKLPYNFSFETVAHLVLDRCPFHLNVEQRRIVFQFLKYESRAINQKYGHCLIHLFPHFFSDKLMSQTNPLEAQVMIGQIRWEIFGLFGQYPSLAQEILPHWVSQNILYFIEFCDQNNFQEEKNGLINLIDLFYPIQIDKIEIPPVLESQRTLEI